MSEQINRTPPASEPVDGHWFTGAARAGNHTKEGKIETYKENESCFQE